MRRHSAVHRSAVGISLVAVAVLAAASFAWACTAAPGVVFRGAGSAASSSAGPAGSDVALEGQDWAEGPVEVRWNSSAGEVLGRPTAAANGKFSVTVRIPGTAKPGVYTLYFMQAQLVARSSFEVTPTPAPANNPETGNDPAGQTSAATSGSDGQLSGSGGRTSTATSGGSGSNASGAPSDGGAQTFGSGGSEASGTESGRSASPAQRPGAPARSGAAARSGGPAVGSGTTGTGSTAGETGTAAATAPTATEPLSAQVFSGDLYSGFGTEGPSLLPGTDDPAGKPEDALGQAALAVGMLSFSLLALFGGVAAAEVRRRKVLARTS